MKVVFIGTYYNHHQSAFSHAMWECLQGQYAFVETQKVSEQRLALGYASHHDEPFLVSYDLEKDKCDQLIREADVAIIGHPDPALMKKAVKAGKVIFRYSERPLKNGSEWHKYIPRLLKWHWQTPPGKPIYLLCAGAYVAYDFGKFGLFRDKAYRWGYFPEAKRYDDLSSLMSQKQKNKLLWCGRFLDWKHPDDALRVAQRLQAEGYDFELNFIGTGDMEKALRQMVSAYELGERVKFLGSMSPEAVRAYMETAGISLVTGDRREGWGAVLNESMNSGCAVVASHMVGSAPYLVRDGENGMLYMSGDVDILYEKIKYLLDHPEEQARLGKEAYETITNEWHADIAAERFVCLAEQILAGNGSPDLYEHGPGSKAEAIKDSRPLMTPRERF